MNNEKVTIPREVAEAIEYAKNVHTSLIMALPLPSTNAFIAFVSPIGSLLYHISLSSRSPAML